MPSKKFHAEGFGENFKPAPRKKRKPNLFGGLIPGFVRRSSKRYDRRKAAHDKRGTKNDLRQARAKTKWGFVFRPGGKADGQFSDFEFSDFGDTKKEERTGKDIRSGKDRRRK